MANSKSQATLLSVHYHNYKLAAVLMARPTYIIILNLIKKRKGRAVLTESWPKWINVHFLTNLAVYEERGQCMIFPDFGHCFESPKLL